MTHGGKKKTPLLMMMLMMMMPWKRCKSAVFLSLATTLLVLTVAVVVVVAVAVAVVVVAREQQDPHRGPQLLAARRSLQGAGPLPPRDSSLFQWSTNHDDDDDDEDAAAAEWEEFGMEEEEPEEEWAGPAAADGRGPVGPRMGEPRGVRDGRRRRRRRPWRVAAHGREPPSGRPTGWDVHVTNCTANSSVLATDWFKRLEERFKDFVLYRHCRFFALLHDSPGRCSRGVADGVAPYLLFVIKSTCANHARRDAIRRTWGREADYHLASTSSSKPRTLRVRTLFLVGLTAPADDGSHHHLQKLVDFESQIYGDILQWDFLDTFYNLTLKEVNFLRWFDIHCGSVRYVFKGDDDVFVNVRNVLEYLSSLRGISARGLFAGDVIWSAAVIRRRDNKYSVPVELYPAARYPPYAGGGGFLMSGDVVRRLWAASGSVENFPIDDVWLGMCLKEAGGFATQHSGFRTFGIVPRRSTWMNAHACFYRGLLLVHKLMPPELLAMWRDVNDPAIKCVRRKRMSLTARPARNGTGPAVVVRGGGGGGGGGGAAGGGAAAAAAGGGGGGGAAAAAGRGAMRNFGSNP